jgi:serine/threonine protein kinase
MDAERWTRLESLFHAAAVLDGEDRERLLRDGCGPDEELLNDLKSLLAKQEAARSFIERPALERAAEILVESDTAILPGRRVGQYIVGEPIGRGGMGDVFRAHDTKLDRDVALKVLPAAFRTDPARLHRFEREAKTITRLNHPNIVTVFDIGLAGDTSFIATELVEGKTLRALMASGKLEPGPAVGYLVQIAEALAAAHTAGIVHRDIKPENVMVRPDGYVKVLDFGLARTVRRTDPEAETRESTLTTDPGTVLGTVAYMSPEQARGYDLDGRTDLWSLGVILYEILHGKRPFTGATQNDVIAAILTSEPKIGLDVPENLRLVLAYALAKTIGNRYAAAADFRDDLKLVGRELDGYESHGGHSGGNLVARSFATDPNAGVETRIGRLKTVLRKKPRLSGLVAGLLLVTVLGGFAGFRWLKAGAIGAPPTPPVAAVKTRKSLAILGFRNLLGDSNDWISPALVEMLRSELAAGDRLRLIGGERVARVKVERDWKDSDEPPETAVAQLRTELGADFLVYGGFTLIKSRAGNQLRLDARVRETATDRVVTVIETGTEEQLFALVNRIGLRLREKLDLGGLTQNEIAALRATLPANQEAARLYAEGLMKLRLYDPLAARDLLEKAVAADPDYPLSHAALAETWTALGYDANALAEGKKAFETSGKLSREESLNVEARYHEAAKNWTKATEIYRTLSIFYPDDLEYGLRLVSAQTAAGGKDAYDTVARLRALPDAVRDDGLIDLSEARAAEALRDFKREIQASSRASANGVKRGARLLVARAKMAEGWAKTQIGEVHPGIDLLKESGGIFSLLGDRDGQADTNLKIGLAYALLGENENAETSQNESLALFRSIGNKRGQARALVAIGNGYFAAGKYPEAQKVQEAALAIFREVGNRNGEAVILNNLGNTLRELSDPEGARRNYNAALAIFRDLGNRSGEATALDGLCSLLSDSGHFAEAAKAFEESLAVKHTLGDREGIANNLVNLGFERERLGDLAGAGKAFEESLETARAIENKSRIGIAQYRLANLRFISGDFDNAESLYREALAAFRETGEKNWIAGTNQAYGRLLGETGRAAEGEKLIREALAEFEAEKVPYQHASASAALARILVRQGKTGPARAALNQAKTLLKKDLPAYYGIIEAELLATEGKFAEALKVLRAAKPKLAEGETQYRLEGDLVEAEIRVRLEKPADPAPLFAPVLKEATEKGYGWFTRRAKSSGQSSAASGQ